MKHVVLPTATHRVDLAVTFIQLSNTFEDREATVCYESFTEKPLTGQDAAQNKGGFFPFSFYFKLVQIFQFYLKAHS